MPLSEHERRLLDEIEDALSSDSPKLASRLGAARLSRSTIERLRGAGGPWLYRVPIGVVALCVGLVVLVVGVWLDSAAGVVVGVLGYLLAVCSVSALITGRRRRRMS